MDGNFNISCLLHIHVFCLFVNLMECFHLSKMPLITKCCFTRLFYIKFASMLLSTIRSNLVRIHRKLQNRTMEMLYLHFV